MGETLVLANLTVDETGVVRGSGASSRAFQTLEGSVTRSASVITARMFSMRQAAQAFLGGFTVAGAILGLRNLVEEAVRASPKFEEVASAWSKFRQELILTLDVALKLNTTLPKTKGWLEETGDAIRKLLLSKEEEQRLERQMAAGAGAFWTPPGPTQTRVPGTLPTGEQLSGAMRNLGLRTVPPFAPQATRIEDSLESLGDLHDFNETLAETVTGFQSLHDELRLIREEDLPDLSVKLPTFQEHMESLADSMSAAQLQFELWVAAAQEFSAAIATSITQGGSFRQFASQMLQGLGSLLLAWGALATITTYFTGYPGFHVAGAAIAAGIAALVAARAIASSGAREERQAGGTPGLAAAGGGTRNLTINVSSPFGNDAALGRYLEDLLRRGERSNA